MKKLGNVCSYSVEKLYFVCGKVGASQTVSNTDSIWFVAKVTGEGLSGHYTCMTGKYVYCVNKLPSLLNASKITMCHYYL